MTITGNEESSSKLKQIEARLEALKEGAKSNKEITGKLVGILDSFEDRVGRLQDTILPVYRQTEVLRHKQQNLEKTLNRVDEVISLYNVSEDVDNIICNAPSSTSLEEFLAAMERIENAVKYFETNNSQSVELDNLRSLYSRGSDALNKEFKDVLTRHSKALPAVAILELIDEDTSGHQNSSISMPENVQCDLKRIAEWLVSHNFDSFMNVYASIRANILISSVRGLKDYQKASSLTMVSPSVLSSPAVASPSSPILKGKYRSGDASRRSRLQHAFEKRASRMLQKATAAMDYSSSFSMSRKSDMKEDTVTDRESEHFLILTTAMLKLMQIESRLMLGVIPMQHRQKIFDSISRESFDLLFRDGESIASRIAKSISRHEYTSLLIIFPIIKSLQTLQPSFDEIFVGSLSSTKANKLTTLLRNFQTTGTKALEEFIENIRKEQTSQLPKDGIVHEVASNVLIFLEHLTEYLDTVATVLAQDPTYSVPIGQHRKLDDETKKAYVGSFVNRVLQQLNVTLITCSDLYYDSSVKAIFRLNNACYILKCLESSILLELLRSKEPDCQRHYTEVMEEQKKAYLIATWKKVADKLVGSDDISVAMLQAGKLRDKDRQTIKDKFSTFNKEMEDIRRTQSSYTVPDSELRDALRRASKEYICPKYEQFFGKYANVQFTKNTEKYIKFTPDDLILAIDNFFESL